MRRETRKRSDSHGRHTASFSPDFRRLVGASSDSTVKVWDALSGQDLLTLKANTENVLWAWPSVPMANIWPAV